MPSVVENTEWPMFAYTTTLRTPSMMPAFTSTSRSRWKSMLDSVRSSIIAATFPVNDRPNPDASSRDGSCNGFSSLPLNTNVNA